MDLCVCLKGVQSSRERAGNGWKVVKRWQLEAWKTVKRWSGASREEVVWPDKWRCQVMPAASTITSIDASPCYQNTLLPLYCRLSMPIFQLCQDLVLWRVSHHTSQNIWATFAPAPRHRQLQIADLHILYGYVFHT